MDSLVQSTPQSVSDHPSVAIFMVFIVTAAEAIAVVGLFMPGTAILLWVGLLAGAGDLPLWPVLGAGTTGAIAGHTVSFWLGRRYQSQLRGAWMFRRWPLLLTRTDQFFRHYGPFSVALGRFLPTIRPMVPLVAGMARMSPSLFHIVNVVSAPIWTATHILPSALAGAWIVTLAPELRLALAAGAVAAFGVMTFVSIRRVFRPRPGALSGLASDGASKCGRRGDRP